MYDRLGSDLLVVMDYASCTQLVKLCSLPCSVERRRGHFFFLFGESCTVRRCRESLLRLISSFT